MERELALSYATNRTNLQLKLDTQGVGGDKEEASKKAEALAKAGKSPTAAKAGPASAKKGATAPGKTDMDDLLER